MLFAYIGPETMMPIASGVAAVVGVFLMFGRSVMLVIRNIGRKVGALVGRKEPGPISKINRPAPVAQATATSEQPGGGPEA